MKSTRLAWWSDKDGQPARLVDEFVEIGSGTFRLCHKRRRSRVNMRKPTRVSMTPRPITKCGCGRRHGPWYSRQERVGGPQLVADQELRRPRAARDRGPSGECRCATGQSDGKQAEADNRDPDALSR